MGMQRSTDRSSRATTILKVIIEKMEIETYKINDKSNGCKIRVRSQWIRY